jgi:hypothetical protein
VPGNDESAGQRRSGKTRKGSKWLSQTLVECAKSANRSNDTYLAAQYRRLRARRGANEATIAVCHSILTAAWHMLQTGETYTDRGGDFFVRRDPERTRKRLVNQLGRLGYTVTVQEGACWPQRDFLDRSGERHLWRDRSSSSIAIARKASPVLGGCLQGAGRHAGPIEPLRCPKLRVASWPGLCECARGGGAASAHPLRSRSPTEVLQP